MTPTGDLTPIKVSGPAGLLAAVPPMLGFHPTNSLVLVCLTGDRRRVGPVARVDLPPGHDRLLAEQLTSQACRHADEVAVISYQDSRRRPPLLDDLLAELDRAGIPVMDAIVVRGGRVRPAVDAAVERRHPGVPVPGPDDPQVAALTAASALAGRSVLADRDQLRRSIAGPTGAALRTAERAVDRVLAGHIRWAEHAAAQRVPLDRLSSVADPTPDDDQRAAGKAMIRPGGADQETPHDQLPAADDSPPAGGPRLRLVGQHQPGADDGEAATDHESRQHTPPSDVTDVVDRVLEQVTATGAVDVQLAIEVAVDLIDVSLRNAVLARAIVELDRPWLPALIACATWTPEFLAADLCAVLAVVAYRHGDGALAQIAVDRCLTVEPKHPLAHLLIVLMSAGARPEELEDMARQGFAAGVGFPLDDDEPEQHHWGSPWDSAACGGECGADECGADESCADDGCADDGRAGDACPGDGCAGDGRAADDDLRFQRLVRDQQRWWRR